MAYYSDELIEEVRSRNDIVDVISGYVRLTKKGSTYFGLCPFHNEKTGSFSVSPNKQMYYCFGCGAGGNVFTFLMQYENFSFPEAMEALAERAGIELPKQEMSAQAKKEADKRQILRLTRQPANIIICCCGVNTENRRMNILKRENYRMPPCRSLGLAIRINTVMICTAI